MDTDVIVVGAGPVGLMLAGELRRGGAEVVVLERLATPSRQTRASTLHSRTMEIFGQRGLLDSLGQPPSEQAGHFGGIRLDFTGLRTQYPGLWKVPQARTEELLADWATGLGASLRRGHELHGLEQSADHVRAEVAGPHGRQPLRARYLVGCDGEGSTVRRAAGIAFPGARAARGLLRADVAGIDIPVRRFQRMPGGLAIAGPIGDGVTRVMMHEYGMPPASDPDDTQPGREPEFADVAAAWARVTGEDISSGTPLWVNAFSDACRQASQYRRGRVLLAGDAAHAQMPAGGQALNLGLQDAVNLGWKLAAEVAGRAAPGLLDSYHGERHPAGARTHANIGAQVMLLLGGPELDPLRELVRRLLALDSVRLHLAGVISGLDTRYPAGPAAHPLVGRPLPYCAITTSTGPTTTTGLPRDGRGVLLDLGGASGPQPVLRAVADAWADRVDLVAAEPPGDGPLAAVGAVLIRPDGHVAWASPDGLDGSSLHTELHQWLGLPAEIPAVT
jgi:2-polyprenyl-6-methoxyphenol hydroxylase-like FAD-dependent oxidoreductase